MAKYKRCDHHDGKCPCIVCDRYCCLTYEDDEGNTVDTDKLCDKAKAYCESGRADRWDNTSITQRQ